MQPTWQSDDGRVRLYLGDCRDVLPHLTAVDAVVTSPPYAAQRDYGEQITDWRGLVSTAICRTPAAAGTQVLVNLGLTHSDGKVVRYWDGLIEDMESSGWRLFGWYVWDKGFGLPGNWNGRLAPSHEWIFHFNHEARGVTKWVRTQGRKASGTGLRAADGGMSGISSPEKCGQPYKVPDSVVRMPPHQLRGGIENEHPAIYPVHLPEHLIRSFTDEGQTVLDPFVGSGTTGVACIKNGRQFIGIEKEPAYFDIAKTRIQEALGMEVKAKDGTTQKRLFVET